ncbi:unnamed protein product [Cuscuta europaea]|uniref:Reverse transcriptase domain-containing protein n=1 Tax=Cuscuta europaea TaxID=41803 RepID=A0A9P0Z3E4_CUSEU|nr:unnamed protein product [Cuscuta europaea]CAH9085420.1 unnamed protein product [Cuscuta europaea]CAH9120380.1 unnamed protein product [Cuscuta europaea]
MNFKAIVWNVRGLKKPSKHSTILNLVKFHQASLCCFLETKMTKINIFNFVSNKWPGWSFETNHDFIDGGRFLVCWNPNLISCNLIEMGEQYMHFKCLCRTSQTVFFATFVYSLYTVLRRKALWEYLALLGDQIKDPWIIAGDFNCVCSPSERVGSNAPSDYFLRDLIEFKIRASLQDAPSTGEFYTWNKGSLWAKLDRVLLNNTWDHLGIQCKAHFDEMEVEFDHTATVISILNNTSLRPKSFKFFNMWIQHDAFTNILMQSWNVNINGTAQFQIAKKLKVLKQPLKNLNKLEFGHISMKTKSAKDEFKRLNKLMIDSPDDAELKERVKVARKRATFLGEAECSFFQQRAKAKHILEADKGTKYFHAIVKRNMARNTITSITMDDGNLTTSIDHVGNEFVKFFVDLFGTEMETFSIDQTVLGTGPLIEPSVHDSLLSPITNKEIKDALFDIGDDKAPGPDGYSSAFFKKNWNIVGEDVIRSTKEFFNSGRLLKQLNHTVIALIPKTSHSPRVSDYRPISCTNVLYKIITKIIAARMIPTLAGLINKAQGAFVDGRLMFDNIFLAQELVRGYNRKRISPRCMIMVDLRKAYDTISWDFLANVLRGLGYPDRFVGWIMECVSTASFSVSLNGTLHGFFNGKRGIRQGDPMSPLLFVVCLEYFSRLLTIKSMDSRFNHHPLCGSLGITHLAYADDLMLFSRGDKYSIGVLVDALKEFGEVSGLRVNHNKSNIFVGGVHGLDLQNILDLVDYGRGVFPVRYLGIPLAPLRISVAQYAPLLDTISDFLNAWNTKTISYAGKLELIRSVIQGVQSFWLQVFPIPQTILDRIVSICRIFLWGGKFSKVAWEDICLPKEEGGLGIHNAKVWNHALLSRTLWDVHMKKDTLWVKWVNGVYLQGRTVWDFIPHTRDSQLMKRLSLIRDKIRGCFNNLNDTIMGLASRASNGKLASAKVYDLLRVKGEARTPMSFIWKSYIPPKLSFNAWLALRNRLPTQDSLGYLYIVNRCDLCQGGLETIPHLFFLCPFTCRVWHHVRSWMGLRHEMSTLLSSIKWIKKTHKGSTLKAKAARIAFCATVYYIWHARNEGRFDGKMKKEEEVVAKIKHVMYKVLYNIYPHELITF